MSIRVYRDNEQPLRAIDMSPLASALLMAVLMLVLVSWPAQIHETPFDLGPELAVALRNPDGHGRQHPGQDYNVVSVDNQNTVTWNGAPVDLVTLRGFIDATQAMEPVPELRISPDRCARYASVALVLATVKRSGAIQVRFAGHERYTRYERLAHCPRQAIITTD